MEAVSQEQANTTTPRMTVEIRGLTKKYGGNVVLYGVNLVLPPAALVGLLGPNGSGKTTLLKTLAGLVVPDAGTISIAGYDARKQEQEARRKLAYVPDVPSFYTELTALEHLELMARAHSSMTDFDQRAHELLSRFGLWKARHNFPFTFSRGMSQKLAICCALIRPSEVLLLDEPGGTLDVRSVHELYAIMDEYRAGGGLVVFSSHQWQTLQDMCDLFVLMDIGQVPAAGNLEALREAAGLDENASLQDVYMAFTDDEAEPDDSVAEAE